MYFITLCTYRKAHLFGDILDGHMRLNAAGQIVEQCWFAIPAHFPHVKLAQFIVMPNHMHGIIHMVDENREKIKRTKDLSSCKSGQLCGTEKTLGSIVRGFKIGVTKWMRQHTPIYDVWQRNYYEHIIRNETDYIRLAEYIMTNPQRWQKDRFYI